MNWKQIKWKIRYVLQYFPFTINTVLCIIAGWEAYRLLNKPVPKGEEPSALLPFILLMGKVTFLFLGVLAAVSVLSTFVSYFYYLWLKGNKGYKLEINFTTEAKKGKKSRLYLNARL